MRWPGSVPRCGVAEAEVGVPHCPILHPPWPAETFWGGDGHGRSPALKGSEEKAPETRGQALLPSASLILGQVLRAASSQILRGRVGLRNKRQLRRV